MRITFEYGTVTCRLIKDDYTQINISEGNTIKYKANYYVNTKHSVYHPFIETDFIGIVDCLRITNGEIIGIYINPTFVYYDNEWNKIN